VKWGDIPETDLAADLDTLTVEATNDPERVKERKEVRIVRKETIVEWEGEGVHRVTHMVITRANSSVFQATEGFKFMPAGES